MLLPSVVPLLCLLVVVSASSACYRVPAVPQDRRVNTDRLRVVTFNAEWLFDGIEDNPEMVPWHGKERTQKHLTDIANVLRAIDADLINVVEVENCQVLHALTVLLGRQYYRYYMVPGSDSATGQNVGLVTKIDPIQNLQRSDDRVRWPIEQSACGYHGRHRESGATKHYHTRLRVNNATLNIVGLHFKAGVNHAPSCAQREAQAEVIRALIQRTSHVHANCEDGSSATVSAGTIVLGDFNDLDGDVVSAVSREKPRSTVLQLLQQLRPDTTDDDLHNLAQLLPKDERYSFHGEVHGRSLRSLIDHVLVSQDLLPLVQSVRIFRDAPGLGSHSKRDRISDHYPYIVDLAANQLRADATHCAAATRTGTNRSTLRDEV